MATNLTNLLPYDKARAFREMYFLRLGAVAVFSLCAVALAQIALLTPTYLFISEQTSLAQRELAALTASLATSEEEAMSARLSALSADATRLLEYVRAPSAAHLIRVVLEVPRTGITLSGFAYTPASPGGTDGRLVLTGVASSRETLRAYHRSLSALPFVTEAELPLSAYAKETDIPFTVGLIGPLLP